MLTAFLLWKEQLLQSFLLFPLRGKKECNWFILSRWRFYGTEDNKSPLCVSVCICSSICVRVHDEAPALCLSVFFIWVLLIHSNYAAIWKASLTIKKQPESSFKNNKLKSKVRMTVFCLIFFFFHFYSCQGCLHVFLVSGVFFLMVSVFVLCFCNAMPQMKPWSGTVWCSVQKLRAPQT